MPKEEAPVEEEEKSSWNLAQGLTIQMSKLISQAQWFYVEGEFHSGFDCMRSVRLCFNQDLGDDERKDLKDKETKIISCFKATDLIKKPIGFNPTKEHEKLLKYSKLLLKDKNIFDLVIEYHEHVQDKLEKYGYLIPKKKSRVRA